METQKLVPKGSEDDEETRKLAESLRNGCKQKWVTTVKEMRKEEIDSTGKLYLLRKWVIKRQVLVRQFEEKELLFSLDITLGR